MSGESLQRALAVADAHPAIPQGRMTDEDLETLAECAEAALTTQPIRLEHVAAHDVPRLLREIVRLRNE